jgi:hypothetical protein
MERLSTQYMYWYEQLEEVEEEGKQRKGKQRIIGNMNRISKQMQKLDAQYTRELIFSDTVKDYKRRKEIEKLKNTGFIK